jgi:DNA-directed RNA polymerase subunit RPC12/RpoP
MTKTMREIEQEYGCFRCGAIRPATDRDPTTDALHCVECGEAAIVTFRQALDMLNGYYVQNKERVVELMDADEYYPDLEETVE